MTNQNDFVIDNGTGFAVRTDIQDALQALAGNSNGNSEPSVKYAYQWWADSNAAVMKLRNSANDGWIELFQLDGTLTLEDGSASTPALAFRDDLNTGIFSSAADTFNVATGGVERLELGNSLTVFNESGADVDFRIEGDTEANLFYVDAGNDRIGIGTASPQVLMHLHQNGARLQFTNTNTGSGATDGIIMGINGDNDFFINNQENNEHILFFTEGSEVARFTDTKRFLVGTSTASTVGNSQYSKFEVCGNTSSATGASALTIKSGTTSASQTNGNTLGRLIFSTLDGGDYAYIQASIDGAMGSSDFPGRMMFFTCADNASTATERMRIDKDGHVGIGMTPSGVRLDVTSTVNDIARFSGPNSGGITVRNDTSHEVQIHSGSNDALIFGTDGENERMRIDSSGKVFIGVTSGGDASAKIRAKQGVAINSSYTDYLHGCYEAQITVNSGGQNKQAGILNVWDGNIHGVSLATFYNGTGYGFVIAVNDNTNDRPIERFTLDNQGTTGINSTSHVLNATTSAAAGGSSVYCFRGHHSGGTISFNVWSNGNVQNTNNSYGSISDIKLKENIIDANSQWEDIKALKIRNYNFKAETKYETHTQIGVVAQELETICPKLVTEIPDVDSDGKDLGTTTKSVNYSVLYMKSIKCLQEAMAKIETLETKVAVLEAA